MKFNRIISKEDKYFNKMILIYKESFPIHEQRRNQEFIEALDNENFFFIGVLDNDKLIGILNYWSFDKYKYIEHFAIDEAFRGKNFGSLILKAFCNDNNKIILEIDPPVDDVSIKRLHFYNRLDFKINNYNHVHPPYRIGYKGHNLKVLSHENKLNEEEYQVFNNYLNDIVMSYSQVKV